MSAPAWSETHDVGARALAGARVLTVRDSHTWLGVEARSWAPRLSRIAHEMYVERDDSRPVQDIRVSVTARVPNIVRHG